MRPPSCCPAIKTLHIARCLIDGATVVSSDGARSVPWRSALLPIVMRLAQACLVVRPTRNLESPAVAAPSPWVASSLGQPAFVRGLLERLDAATPEIRN